MQRKVGFVIQHIENKGGEERMCSIIANYLSEHGYKVTIISLWTKKHELPFYQLHPNIDLKYIMDSNVTIRLNHWFPWLDYFHNRLKTCLRKLNLDILIDVDTNCTPITSKALKGLDTKHIAWDHFCYSNFEKKHMSRLPYLRRDIDKLIVLTKDDLRDYVNKAKIEPSKVCQIYNPSPIELSEYLPHYKKKVLAIGRLEEQKRFDRLLNIWAKVEKEDEEWELEIVGDGRKELALKEQAEVLGLKRVMFSPSTTTPLEKYKDASIFLLTSQYEGFGLVVVEALNASLPVISFDCDNGPREIIIEGVNGYLIEQDNIDDFKKKLLLLMKDDKLRLKMSHNCHSSVDVFNLNVIGKQWEQLIDEL